VSEEHTADLSTNNGRRRTSTAVGIHCGHCTKLIPVDRVLRALVLDSSVIHPSDPSQDGYRVVTACANDHLHRLIEQARHSWVDEQLWFGKLCRASLRPDLRDASMDRLADYAGLTADALRRALAWNIAQPLPHLSLPGGQRLADRVG
jgi:hypothetical protein